MENFRLHEIINNSYDDNILLLVGKEKNKQMYSASLSNGYLINSFAFWVVLYRL